MSEFNSKFIKYLCLLLFLKGCAYFNTFYNAEEHFETAERIRIENLGSNIPSRAIQEYGKAIEKSEKVINYTIEEFSYKTSDLNLFQEKIVNFFKSDTFENPNSLWIDRSFTKDGTCNQ